MPVINPKINEVEVFHLFYSFLEIFRMAELPSARKIPNVVTAIPLGPDNIAWSADPS